MPEAANSPSYGLGCQKLTIQCNSCNSLISFISITIKYSHSRWFSWRAPSYSSQSLNTAIQLHCQSYLNILLSSSQRFAALDMHQYCMDNGSLFSFFSYLTTIFDKQIFAISPHYANRAQGFICNMYFGNVQSFQIALMPINISNKDKALQY